MIELNALGNKAAFGTALLCALLTVGCNKTDPKACSHAMDVTRESLKDKNVALARRWRDYAWKQCDDKTALQAFDKEVVAGEDEITKEKQEEEQKKTQSQELLGLFVQWAGDHRASPDAAGADVSCEPEEKPEKGAPPPKLPDKPHRFCTRTRAVSDSFNLQVRYREDDPGVVHFQTIAPSDVSCDALGANKVLKKWPARTECEITGGRLQGLDAVITRATDGTHVEVFSTQYLDRDAALKNELR
jgi:hypothetical protein